MVVHFRPPFLPGKRDNVIQASEQTGALVAAVDCSAPCIKPSGGREAQDSQPILVPCIRDLRDELNHAFIDLKPPAPADDSVEITGGKAVFCA